MSFSKFDIERFIKILRKYGARRIPVPNSFINNIGLAIERDADLSCYFYERILRFPTARRALIEALDRNVEVADDETGEIPDQPSILKPLSAPAPTAQPEMMFR